MREEQGHEIIEGADLGYARVIGPAAHHGDLFTPYLEQFPRRVELPRRQALDMAVEHARRDQFIDEFLASRHGLCASESLSLQGA